MGTKRSPSFCVVPIHDGVLMEAASAMRNTRKKKTRLKIKARVASLPKQVHAKLKLWELRIEPLVCCQNLSRCICQKQI